jgi:hypothetical protein
MSEQRDVLEGSQGNDSVPAQASQASEEIMHLP